MSVFLIGEVVVEYQILNCVQVSLFLITDNDFVEFLDFDLQPLRHSPITITLVVLRQLTDYLFDLNRLADHSVQEVLGKSI